MLINFFTEIWDEAEDFFDDFGEHLFNRRRQREIEDRRVKLNGVITKVRPAYLFAERLDNMLKLLFGFSMCISAVTASFYGYSTLSQLLTALINSPWGRVIIFVIGMSTLITGIWKMFHLNPVKSNER